MATKKPPKKTALSVDFSDTETQALLPEGEYVLEVDEVEQKTSDNSGSDYLGFTFKVAEGDFKGKKVYHNCSLQPQALFNLRGVLEALGYEVPTGVMELDPTDLIGERCGASIAHEKYEGKTKLRPVEFFPEDQVGENRSPDPVEAKSTKKAGKAAEEPAEPAKPSAKKVVKKKDSEPEFEEGDEVTFTDDEGEEQSGTITSVDGDAYTVTVGKGKKATEWELEASDLTKVD